MSRQFDYSKNPRMIYIVKEHLNLYRDLGVTVGFNILSSINGSDKTNLYEFLRLNYIRGIKDEPSRLLHVACEEKTRETLAI